MAENKSSVSNASSYAEIGEVDFDVRVESSVMYFAVEKALAEKLRAAARTHGVSSETLLNVWVQEHVAGESSK